MLPVTQAPIKLVIFEASLELVPRELARHPSVYKPAWRRGKRPEETLLDASLHRQAMRSAELEEAEKRGRPDVVHVLLLEATSSPLVERGLMDVYVHTIGDYALYVRRGTRIPRNYNRFVGLMEQLLLEGRVPPDAEEPLIEARPMSLRSLVKHLGVRHVLLYSWGSGGKRARIREVAKRAAGLAEDGGVALLLPGFPHGDPSEAARSTATEAYEPVAKLEAWTLLSHTLALIADNLGLV